MFQRHFEGEDHWLALLDDPDRRRQRVSSRPWPFVGAVVLGVGQLLQLGRRLGGEGLPQPTAACSRGGAAGAMR
jgi:hypothetical protein